MSIQARMELVRVQYTRLLKLELVSYINNIIRIVDKHDPELLKVNGTFDLLVAEMPQIKKMDVPYKAHPLTKKVVALRKMRTVYVGSIFNHLRVVESENNEGENLLVNEVKVELQRYLKNLKSCKSEAERCQKVIRFFDEIDKNKELKDAFISLKFSEHLDKLRNVNSNIMMLGSEIIRSTSKRPTEKTAVLRKSVVLATEDFFKELEVAQVKNKDLDYKPLYDELNRLSVNYRNAVSRRVLHNKQKAEKKNILVTNQPEKSEEAPTLSQNAQSFVQSTYHVDTEELDKKMNGNRKDNSNGFEAKPLRQGETVAALAKYQQLPAVDDGS